MAYLAAMIAAAAIQLLVRRPHTREQRAEWLHEQCAKIVRRLGISVVQKGRFPKSGVIIANHQGYLDIVAFAALQRCVFVSKSEIASWPVMGWITTMSGTIYVKRGHGGSAQKAKSEMRLVSGVPIVFFPEGTSSNGETVLKFHSGLLANAIEDQQPVTAAYIRYHLTEQNGHGISAANTLAYWDDTPLFVHIFRVLGLHGIRIEVRFAGAPIPFTVGAEQRKLAAEQARTAVLQLAAAESQAMA